MDARQCHEWIRPLPSLLAQAREILLDEQHRRLEHEGFGGLRFGHACVFRHINSEGSRLTVLAERSGLAKQTVAEVVSELERLGYIERVADPRDGRAKLIRLTQRGRAGQAAAARALVDIERGWAHRLGLERITALRQVLEEIPASSDVPASTA